MEKLGVLVIQMSLEYVKYICSYDVSLVRIVFEAEQFGSDVSFLAPREETGQLASRDLFAFLLVAAAAAFSRWPSR